MSVSAVEGRLFAGVVENRKTVLVAFVVVAAASLGLLLGVGARHAFLMALFGMTMVISVASFEWAMAVFFFLACAQNWYPLYVKAGGFNVRFSHFLTFILLQTLVVEHVKGRIRLQRIPYFWAFAALFGATLVSTILYSPLLNRGLGTAFLLGANIAHYALAYWLVTARPGFYRRGLRLLAKTTVLLVVAGLFNVFFLIVDIPVLSEAFRSIATQQALADFSYTQTSTVIFRPRGWGTSTGCYISALGFFSLGSVFDRHVPRRMIYQVAAFASVIGVIISLARGPLLSFGISLMTMLVLFLFSGSIKHLGRFVYRVLAVFVFVLPTIYALRNVPFIEGFFARVSNVSNIRQGSALPRLYTWGRMIDDIRSHPLMGVGADTYRLYMSEFHLGPLLKYPSENFPLEVLHSSGLMGFVPYLIAHVGIVVLAFRSLVRMKPFSPTIVGVIAGFTGLWLGGSTTNIAATGAAYWILLAMVAAVPYLQPRTMGGTG